MVLWSVTFLGQQGSLNETFKVVTLHGTLDLSAIVLAGGAGFVMGNSILFQVLIPECPHLNTGRLKG
ncbi:MAG: putative membrane protein SpoIIM required for sporulation [Arcticibacterium sp.]|jgi:uncharacterized membrane protein SpoIIM required for sporulation